MKGLEYILGIFALLIGRHHRSDDLWSTLLILLIIQAISDFLIRKDVKRGVPFGDPVNDLFDGVKDNVNETVTGSVLKKAGVPENLAEGYLLSRSTRKEVYEPGPGLGCRVYANLLWTIGIVILSIYCTYKW